MVYYKIIGVFSPPLSGRNSEKKTGTRRTSLKNAKSKLRGGNAAIFDVFDAYCGTGTIGLIASKKAKSVMGVEIVKEAIKNAKNNAELNQIRNSSFIVGDAGEVIERLANDNKRFDIVFVDPPRKGLDDKFINTLLRIKPNKVIYVSCEPETLARDVAKLSSLYSIRTVQPVDMFPMTYHVETIIGLYRKDK